LKLALEKGGEGKKVRLDQKKGMSFLCVRKPPLWSLETGKRFVGE